MQNIYFLRYNLSAFGDQLDGGGVNKKHETLQHGDEGPSDEQLDAEATQPQALWAGTLTLL